MCWTGRQVGRANERGVVWVVKVGLVEDKSEIELGWDNWMGNHRAEAVGIVPPDGIIANDYYVDVRSGIRIRCCSRKSSLCGS